MATELSRRTFVIPATGEPAFIIEQGRDNADLPEDNFSRFKVVVANRTIRDSLTDGYAAEQLMEALGGVETSAGDERAIAAELGGNSVFQAAMAPRVTELAAELADHKAENDGQGERVMAAAVVTGQAVPDSQATGVMEVTTGLGGVRSHGLGERFDGAASDHLDAAAAKVQAEDDVLAARQAATPPSETDSGAPIDSTPSEPVNPQTDGSD